MGNDLVTEHWHARLLGNILISILDSAVAERS
jgi:hypothetical protein